MMVSVVEKNLKRNKEDKLEWLVNIDALYKNFQEVPYFDESLINESKTIYQLVGENSENINSNTYSMDQYKKVFPNIQEENVVVVKDAGHWVHFDQPQVTIEYISKFLDEIDSKK